MRAWLMDSMAGVEALRMSEVGDPQPGPSQVLLKVKVAALNPADSFLAQGMYPVKPPLPHILGRDGVGSVLAVGPGVKNIEVGETVGILRCNVGIDMWGTLAEKVVVPMESVTRIPDGLASPDPVARASGTSTFRVCSPSDRRIRRCRRGVSVAWQIDGAHCGGFVTQ